MKRDKEYQIVTHTGVFSWEKIKHPKFKYRVTKTYSIALRFKPPGWIQSKYFEFMPMGLLVIKKGYRWDGASGPTIDTESTMRASAVHDVIYQMIREGDLIPAFKSLGDLELPRLMIEDYRAANPVSRIWSRFRAGYYYQAVKLFGASSCRPLLK